MPPEMLERAPALSCIVRWCKNCGILRAAKIMTPLDPSISNSRAKLPERVCGVADAFGQWRRAIRDTTSLDRTVHQCQAFPDFAPPSVTLGIISCLVWVCDFTTYLFHQPSSRSFCIPINAGIFWVAIGPTLQPGPLSILYLAVSGLDRALLFLLSFFSLP